MSEPILNMLQSFMGCMYPGSIRTESIESVNTDYQEYRYEVENINERLNVVSVGLLQLTDRDLIYFRPGKFPTRWRVNYIRRFGCSPEGDIFSFEAGRRCQTGTGIFAFRLKNAADLTQKLMTSINKCDIQNEYSPEQSPTCERVTCSKNCAKDMTKAVAKVLKQQNNARIVVESSSTQSQRLGDAYTSKSESCDMEHNRDPMPLPYSLIDFEATNALTAASQSHFACRQET